MLGLIVVFLFEELQKKDDNKINKKIFSWGLSLEKQIDLFKKEILLDIKLQVVVEKYLPILFWRKAFGFEIACL